MKRFGNGVAHNQEAFNQKPGKTSETHLACGDDFFHIASCPVVDP